ncbi:DUF3341 domain-containing protein [Sorangium sp. So ce260]|uniref:DUF3341 domain-containing protein n=1 Tax=Sorangium sp. So ce260 TaxID=3133291 RepID=UPI003F5DC5F3
MQRDSDPPSQKRSGEPASAGAAAGHKKSVHVAEPDTRDREPDLEPQGYVPENPTEAEYANAPDPHDDHGHGGLAALAVERRVEHRLAEAKVEARLEAEGASPPFALMGYFTTPQDIYHACEALRDAGYSRFDAHTPFPVHGLEKAMGLKASPLPWLVLGGGATGLVSAVLLAWYTQLYDYPLIISGKPSFSYHAFIPIFFELTVLFAALTCFFGLFALGRLPSFFHPTMTHPSFPRATDDAFFISVEVSDPKFDATETRNLLQRVGAQGIREVSS